MSLVPRAGVGPLHFLALCAVGACAATKNVEIPAVTASPPGDAFVIFSGADHPMVDSVRVQNDTLFAREFTSVPGREQPPVRIPVTAIDSIRRAHPDRSALVGAAFPFGAMVAFMFILRLGMGSD